MTALRRRRRLRTAALVGLLTGALLVGLPPLAYRLWWGGVGPLAEERIVLLAPGSGVRGIARHLAEAGVIDRPLLFMLAARLNGHDRDLRAGEFRFEPGMGPRAVLERLVGGSVVQHALTIPEGLTVREVWALLEASPFLTGDLPPPPPEGSLLPETWLVPRGEPRARVVLRMREAMDAALAQAWAGRADALPWRSPAELLAAASLIERETPIAAERPLVAAVIVNRLRRGMRLQIDPTVIYAATEGRGALERPLGRADLDRDHPYNTYKNAGLPPGPIANPGRLSLHAAAHPAAVPYLYFVADGSGGHAFAADLEAHNRNVRAWRRQQQAAPSGAPD